MSNRPRKRNAMQLTVSKQNVKKLLIRGYTKEEIAELVSMSIEQVDAELNMIYKEITEANIGKSNTDLIAIKLAEYAEVKKEAWKSWEESKKGNKTKYKERSVSGKGKNKFTRDTKSITVKGSIGDSTYLRLILECAYAERELLGINPAEEVHVQGTINQINWDILSLGIPESGPIPDEVEAELDKIAHLPPPDTNGHMQ